MRRLLCVAALFAVAACDARTPTTPIVPPPAPSFSGLIAEVDRTHVPHPAGDVKVTVQVAASNLPTSGATIPIEIRLQDIENPTLTQLAIDASGRGQQTYNFGRPGSLTVKAGNHAQTFTITQDAPWEPPPPPPPPAPRPETPAPPPPGPSLFVTLAADDTSVDTLTPVTFTATATPQNGAAAVTAYEWDLDGNGTYEATTATNTRQTTYATAATYNARVRVTNGTQTAISSTIAIAAGVPVLNVSIAANPTSAEVGAAITFTATTTSGGTLPSSLLYDWSDDGSGDETYEATNITGGASVDRAKTFSTIGTKTVRVRVRGGGATATSTTTVTVTAPALLVSLTVTAPAAPYDVGEAITFQAAVTSTGTVPSGLIFEWDEDNDGTFDAVDSDAGNGATETRVVTFTAAGNHTVRVRVTDSATGRTATTTRTITVQ